MGWINERYRDGTSLVWHNGAIDGFTAYIGFLPGRDLGLAVLNSMNPVPTGMSFYTPREDAWSSACSRGGSSCAGSGASGT